MRMDWQQARLLLMELTSMSNNALCVAQMSDNPLRSRTFVGCRVRRRATRSWGAKGPWLVHPQAIVVAAVSRRRAA